MQSSLILISFIVFGYIIIRLIVQFSARAKLIKSLDTDCQERLCTLAASKKDIGKFLQYSEIESETYLYTDKYEESIKVFIGSFVAIGMVFTFIGLTFSISQIHTVLDNLDGNNFGSVIEGLLPVLGGMTLAFVSSLTGLVLSLIFNLWNNRVKIKMESKLDDFIYNFKSNVLPNYAPPTTELQIGKAFETQQREMKDFFEQFLANNDELFSNFIEKNEELFDTISENNKEMFDGVANKITNSLKDIHSKYSSTFEEFSLALDNLNTNINAINQNIVSGTSSMSQIEGDITQAIGELTSNSQLFAQKIDIITNFSKPLEDSAEKFEELTEGMLHSMDTFAGIISGSTLKDDISNIQRQLSANESGIAQLKSEVVDRTTKIEKTTKSDEILETVTNQNYSINEISSEVQELSNNTDEKLDAISSKVDTINKEMSDKVVNEVKTIDDKLSSLKNTFEKFETEVIKEISKISPIALKVPSSISGLFSKKKKKDVK